jgi:hypothetical protein
MSDKKHIVHPFNSCNLPKDCEQISYCGVRISQLEWYFEDASHAILAIEQHSLIEPCEKCLKRIKEIIG